MTEKERFKITDNAYFDLIIKYSGSQEFLKKYSQYTVQVMSEYLAVVYIPVSQVTPSLMEQFGYGALPKCYALESSQSLEASGINKLRRIPTLGLRGKGVVVGIIDTGIDYTNPVFQNKDGTTRILSIWDQSIDSENQYPTMEFPSYYGTEYTSEQINQALKSENPLEIVPSTDTIGHGTMLAGIAAGSENTENDFSGVAPEAEFIIVKLKQAKDNLRDFFFIPQGVPCYQGNDILWAMRYILYSTSKLKRPLALCIGLGTSQGAHDDSGILNTTTSIFGDTSNVAISIAGGNEGSAKRHFYSVIDPITVPVNVELNVGEGESGFSMEMWGDPPDTYTLDILSPTGEYIPRIPESLEENQKVSFIFEQTIIYVDYVMIEQETGKQVIILRFSKPTPGTWKFKVYGRGDLKGYFHMWLPSDGFISLNTYFMNSDPYTTLTSPGNSFVPISVIAYDPASGALYINSGKGFSTSNIINPTLAAPGVNIQCPDLKHGFTTLTGTSAAAAHTTGITAMLLEWCTVENNYPDIDTVGIKKFLMRGAKRSNNLQYPNRDWGYGIIDVYNTFNILRTDTQ